MSMDEFDSDPFEVSDAQTMLDYLEDDLTYRTENS